MSHLRTLLLITFIGVFITPIHAQLPNVTDITATPAAGDHDYLHSQIETVNPANGSISIRIPISLPPGRQLALPFYIAYDSNGAFYMSPTGSGPEYRTEKLSLASAYGPQGGWSYTYPLISYASNTWTIPGSRDGLITCHGSFNYVFQGPDGARHNLGLSVSANVASPDGYDNCNQGIQGDGEYPSGGEGPILASTSVPSSNTSIFPPVYVTDADGTTYYIGSHGPGTGATFLASSVIDRNTNSISVTPTGSSGVVYNDTIGRAALSVSSIGGNPDTITPAGVTSPYKVYWTAISAHFTDNMVNLVPGVDPNCPTSMSATSTVISQIVLPNGKQFNFSYDTTYGMLTKIIYPGGGYVRYVWGLNSQAEAGSFPFTNNSWVCRYDFPAVTDRYVSYDGSTEVEHQHFTYSTSWTGNSSIWTSKSTSISTTDAVRGATFNTTYVYSSFNTPYVPNCVGCNLTVQIPVEKTLQNYDFDGSLLQTVAKSWKNVRLVQTVQTTPTGGSPSLKVYCYDSWEEPMETDEYNAGTGTPTGACVSPPSGTTSGPLVRKSSITYQDLATQHIVDRPNSVVIYDGSGTKVAETDPSYDQYGNLKTTTARCLSVPGGATCPQGDSTTTYTYDSHGQETSSTDADGNAPTKYYYTDNYSSCGLG